MPKQNNKHGFTLIELLVVITILGIMASIITYGLVGQQRKARDAQRKSDLNSVKTAIEANKNDCRNAAYYRYIGGASFEGQRFPLLNSGLVTNGYLNIAVTDPINSGEYYYRYVNQVHSPAISNACGTGISGTSNYILRAKLEITNDPQLTSSYNKCSSKFSLFTWNAPADPVPATNDGFYYLCNN